MNLQTTLFEFQQPAVDKLIKSKVGALFMDMGLGKTRIVIEMAHMRQNRISNVVWFTLVNLKETVRQEILKHTDATDADICVFDDKTKQPVRNAFWYVVGIESMSSSNRVTLAANSIINASTFMVVDESTYIKGHHSRRTARITAMGRRAKYRMILTGTPMTQGVVDLFAQMRFLSPKILGYNSFYSFARNHLEYSEKYPGMVIRSHRTDYLAAKIAPYTYQITKEEAGVNLPAKLYDSRYHNLTWQQQEAYEEAKHYILDLILEENSSEDFYLFQLFTALQQIVSGFWNKRLLSGDFVFNEYTQTRTHLLASTVETLPSNEKVLIWCKYRYSIQQIDELLRSEYGNDSVVLFYGDLSEAERNQSIADFRSHARFLVATQGSGGHGLTLNEAAYAIYYENEFKYSHRAQSEDRNHRLGQVRRPTYIDLWADCGIEIRIRKALAEKGNAAESFRREVKAVKKKGRGALTEFLKGL